MTYAWPEMLWLLAGVPVLVCAYVLLMWRKKRAAIRYASVDLVKAAIGPGQRLRRHLPPLLLLLSLITLIVAMARPSVVITLPSLRQTIILAIDVSLSMRASDVEPSRLEAAQSAAKAFVAEQPPDVLIGIVSFAGTAAVVQPPTRDRDALVAAIDRFNLQRHTAIGSGIIMSLATLFPDAGIDLEEVLFGGASSRRLRGVAIERQPKTEQKPFTPVEPGSYSSAAIILLTDGRTTTGPPPLEAAKMAADRGVRVFTVGFGTAGGGAVDFEGWSMFMRFDEETLKAIAEITRAEYFHAATGTDLRRIYERLNARAVLVRKETEIGALLAGAAAVLAIAAGLLSLVWFTRFA
ncbi:MAG: VWA domain-containing protein [Burkholderiales bacterium]|nr:VWA domain-containing protein [Burkholderiales bacterium]